MNNVTWQRASTCTMTLREETPQGREVHYTHSVTGHMNIALIALFGVIG